MCVSVVYAHETITTATIFSPFARKNSHIQTWRAYTLSVETVSKQLISYLSRPKTHVIPSSLKYHFFGDRAQYPNISI